MKMKLLGPYYYLVTNTQKGKLHAICLFKRPSSIGHIRLYGIRTTQCTMYSPIDFCLFDFCLSRQKPITGNLNWEDFSLSKKTFTYQTLAYQTLTYYIIIFSLKTFDAFHYYRVVILADSQGSPLIIFTNFHQISSVFQL